MPKKEDFYIAMLKYGRDALRKSKTVNHNEVLRHVNTTFPKIEGEHFSRIFWDTFELIEPFTGNYGGRKERDIAHTLNISSYFHLLEHEELEEARTASRKALQRSTWAIAISAVLAAASIGMQVIPTNVILSERQVERILNASSAPRQVVLDQNQLENLLKSSESPKNVLLDAAQLEQLLKQISQSNSAPQ